MGSDPRLQAAMRVYEYDDIDVFAVLLPKVLAAADAADRDRGVVRVDTRDDTTQERAAKALSDWGIRGYEPEDYAALAHAVLAALAREDNHG